jgi:hypothetical protein
MPIYIHTNNPLFVQAIKTAKFLKIKVRKRENKQREMNPIPLVPPVTRAVFPSRDHLPSLS